jgi:hypothetical protein
MGETWDEKLIRCECHSLDHVVHFQLDDYGSQPELSISTHLSTWRGFWNRLWNGTKYILGLKQRHGNWDEVLISYDRAKELRAMLDKYIAMRDTWAEKMTAGEP